MAKHQLFRDGVLVYEFDGPAHHQLMRDGVSVYDFTEGTMPTQHHQLLRDGVSVYEYTGAAHHELFRDSVSVYDFDDTGGGTQPPYNGPIDWHLGAPGEVSPTNTIKNIQAEAQYAAEVTKINDGTTLRIQAANSGPWWNSVISEIPGVRGEQESPNMGGSSEVSLAGAPNGPGLVVVFRVTRYPDPASPSQGTVAPQVVAL